MAAPETGADALRRWAYSETSRGKFLASSIGVSCAAVSVWVNGKVKIPPTRCKSIARVTGIPKHILRPDVFDPQDDKGPTP